MDWHQLKAWLETASGLNMDALHVHAGVVLQLVAALALRRPLRSPLPWLAVLLAEGINEYYDLAYEIWPNRGDQWAESVRDMWNTMLIPTLLFVLARWAPAAFAGRPAAPSGGDAGEAGGEAR
ncbi:MAG: hypothetical protein JOZ90_17525 [Alphaproteobacteria bacterium]|nr:hypothetical protein [Alphaproteobacteria bacterium]MBV9373097.1 hypothetical protein [Alphaproteobacteria bacterium]MBV9902873.1 hypothetical protein [Alphaproteobacteria bacterium]